MHKKHKSAKAKKGVRSKGMSDWGMMMLSGMENQRAEQARPSIVKKGKRGR